MCMNANEKNLFYLLWTLAIFVCAALAVFVLLRASFGKQESSPPAYIPSGYSDTGSSEPGYTDPGLY